MRRLSIFIFLSYIIFAILFFMLHTLTGHTILGEGIYNIIMAFFIAVIIATSFWEIIFHAKKQKETEARLEILESTLNAAKDMIFYKDINGVYINCNQEFASLFDITPNQIYGKTDDDLFAPENAAYNIEQDHYVLKDKKLLRYEAWIKTRNGSKRILRELVKAPCYDGNGELSGVVGVARDITEQHRIRSKLFKRERLLFALTNATQHILSNSNDFSSAVKEALKTFGIESEIEAVFLLKESDMTIPENIIFNVNNYWLRDNAPFKQQKLSLNCNVISYDEITNGKIITQITDKGFSADSNKALKDASLCSFLAASIYPSGIFWGIILLGSKSPSRKWTGAEKAVIEIFATQLGLLFERQNAEDTLYAAYSEITTNQRRFELALSAANAAAFEYDVSTDIVSIDESFYKSLEYNTAWEQPSISDIIFLAHKEDQSKLRNTFSQLLSDEKSIVASDIRIRKKSGDYIWCNVKAMSHWDADNITKVVGLLQDINDKKQAEKELLQSEKMAAIGTLAAGVAHNFNNINTGISGHLQLLKNRETLSQKGLAKINLILKTVERSNKLTDSLLAFSGKRRGKPALHHIKDLVEDTVSLAYNDFAAAQIEFLIDIDPNIMAFCCPGEICHILFNLFVNAKHAMINSKVKTININSECKDNFASIKVADNGCGISNDTINNIFTPFFTTKGEHAEANSELAAIKGSGLGLSSSKAIIENQGGRIEVESTLGEGSAFTIWIPLQKS